MKKKPFLYTLPEYRIDRANQGLVKRCIYATQSFKLLHSSGMIHINFSEFFSKGKQKENIKYK